MGATRAVSGAAAPAATGAGRQRPATINIGLVGYGTVGGKFMQLLAENGAALGDRYGCRLQVTRIGVAHPDKPRPVAPPAGTLVQGFAAVVDDADVHVVVEMMGGVDGAREAIRAAIGAGKHVITANKALIASDGAELLALAAEHGVQLRFEASVCGAIPVIKVIRESLVANRIRSLTGIVNGTTNYILTRMTDSGATFAAALAEAQELGYAEADPTLDVDGTDAVQKMSILASLAFGGWCRYQDALWEGITTITPKDIAFARLAGFVFKLVASAREVDGQPSITVFPALVREAHPLAAIANELNAVLIDADYQGPSVLVGRGAGGAATASSLAADLGDLLALWRDRPAAPWAAGGAAADAGEATGAGAAAGAGAGAGAGAAAVPTGARTLYPAAQLQFRYFFHFVTENRPGIWAQVTGLLADHQINIESVHQKWEDPEQPSDLYVLVDPMSEQQALAALEVIRAADGIYAESRFYRILAEDDG